MDLQSQQIPVSDTEVPVVVDMRDVVGMLVTQLQQTQAAVGMLMSKVMTLEEAAVRANAIPKPQDEATPADSDTGQYL